jgi:hypothetical protein
VAADIVIVPLDSFIAPGQGVFFDIYLSNASLPIDSLYGIAFTLEFDPQLVIAPMTALDWSTSVLGTIGSDMQSFAKYFPATGRLDIALTRINHTNMANVIGSIGRLHLGASLSVSNITPLQVNPSNIIGITAGENELEFNPASGTTIIDPALIGISETSNENVITVYPNPATENVMIAINGTTGANYSLLLYDFNGKCVYDSQTTSSLFRLDVSEWNAGIYSGRVISDDQKEIRNFRITVIN